MCEGVNVCAHGWSHVSSPRGLHPLHPGWPPPTMPSGTFFFQMTKTYSLSACLFERMWECVTLPVCALNQAAALRYYTCKHGHGVIYWSHLLSLSAPWMLQRSWVHIFPHPLFAHLLVLFHRETNAGKPPFHGVFLFICHVIKSYTHRWVLFNLL